jgi:hypothetical protein
MDMDTYGEFRLRPAKNGWTVRSFGEFWVYQTDSEIVDALKEHMKRLRADQKSLVDADVPRR